MLTPKIYIPKVYGMSNIQNIMNNFITNKLLGYIPKVYAKTSNHVTMEILPYILDQLSKYFLYQTIFDNNNVIDNNNIINLHNRAKYFPARRVHFYYSFLYS